ncbi:acyl-CoA dehydrogenase family protein [Halomonas sp. PR-M31]|uniref:acyl-CoA dehydrogenase family protein n=1 Tax=Halomonas sp. PR-M31 TaxID=1471202 RepID=UPI000651CDE6|nr:acyl-CoA dehydrogenase [Halomonas sp. PR-M31]
MSLVYSEEHRMLADSARDFLTERSPVAAQRALRDQEDTLGFDPTTWREMIELGWSGIPFAEQYGGLEFGMKGMGAVFEELGRELSPSPMLSSVVLAGSLIGAAGSVDQRQDWLPLLIQGEKRLALAVDEGARHDPSRLSLTAKRESVGYRLSGDKVMVLDGHEADGWIVAARTDEGDDDVSLFLVPAGTSGVSTTRLWLVDSRNVANLHLDNVVLDASYLLGEPGRGKAALERALDHGRVCLAAEMQGICETLFATTLDYLRTRVQFDVRIGSFQALQHRAAWLHVELALARSTLMAALDAIDRGAQDAAAQVSLAKWKVGQMADRVGNEAVQLHGGIGVTDELNIGLYLKRLRVAQASLGDADYHLARYAELSQE